MTQDIDTTSTPADGIALDHTAVHIRGDERVVALEGFTFDPAGFEAYIAEHTGDGEPGRLVFVERSDSDWGSWERHPHGDEIVIVLSGVACFVQEIDGAEVRTRVTAGRCVVNPAGVWHTADVEVPFAAVYLTPCPDTQHRRR